MLYKVPNRKYLFFIICLLILCVDFCFFDSIFDFKRHMVEKFGFLYLLPFITTWFIFLKLDMKFTKNIRNEFTLASGRLLLLLIVIGIQFIVYYILFIVYVLFFMGIPE